MGKIQEYDFYVLQRANSNVMFSGYSDLTSKGIRGTPDHETGGSCGGNGCQQHADGGGVFDPFGGSGTTIAACHQIARKGCGIEIDPSYVAVALERLSGMGLVPKLVGQNTEAVHRG
jgi:hypothetical protein